MRPLRTSLSEHLPRTTPLNDGELRAMAAVVWHRFGLVVVKPDDLHNPFDRQAVVNAATRLYGPRVK